MNRYQAGVDPGKLKVYRALGGLYPGNAIMTTDGRNTTTDWVHEQYFLEQDDVGPNLRHEVRNQ